MKTESTTTGWTNGHTGIAGIVSAVLLVAGVMLAGNTPDYTAPDAEWVSWYEDSSNTRGAVLAAFLIMLAVVALVGFIGGLAQRMRADTARMDALQTITIGGGVILAASLLFGGILMSGAAGAIEFTDFPVPDADVLKMAEQAGYSVFLLGSGVGAFLLFGGASLVARRSGLLPTWLAIAGLVAAILLLVGAATFLPMGLIPLWLIAVSVVFLRSGVAAQA